jgi:hypothetical protein
MKNYIREGKLVYIRLVNCWLLGWNAVGKRPFHFEVSTFNITLLIWSTLSTYLESPKWKLSVWNSKWREPNSERNALPPLHVGLQACPLRYITREHKVQHYHKISFSNWSKRKKNWIQFFVRKQFQLLLLRLNKREKQRRKYTYIRFEINSRMGDSCLSVECG